MNVSILVLNALSAILPGAEITVIHDRPWHSMTFSGAQICIAVVLRGNSRVSTAIAFERTLPSHQFDLRGQLVADIAVVQQTGNNCETHLLIDALVLED